MLVSLCSCLFGTFLFNTERERVEANLSTRTKSLWDHVDANVIPTMPLNMHVSKRSYNHANKQTYPHAIVDIATADGDVHQSVLLRASGRTPGRTDFVSIDEFQSENTAASTVSSTLSFYRITTVNSFRCRRYLCLLPACGGYHCGLSTTCAGTQRSALRSVFLASAVDVCSL